MKTRSIKDHLYVVVGCVNLLDLRIVASVTLSVTGKYFIMFFHCPQRGKKNQFFPLAFKGPWHVALHPPTSPPTTLTLGPSHSGLSTCQVYSSLRAFALLFPLLRTFQHQIFKWLRVLSSCRVLPHHCISVDYPYLSYSVITWPCWMSPVRRLQPLWEPCNLTALYTTVSLASVTMRHTHAWQL